MASTFWPENFLSFLIILLISRIDSLDREREIIIKIREIEDRVEFSVTHIKSMQ